MERAVLSMTLQHTPTNTANKPNVSCCYYKINRLQLVCSPFRLFSSFDLVKSLQVYSSFHLLNCFHIQSEKKITP